MRPKGCRHGYSETVYFLSVPVCAGSWWRFIVQTHTAPNSQNQLTNWERSPANEPSFHQTFGLSWWRSCPFPHRVNTQRSEFLGTDLECSVPGKTTLYAVDRSGLNKQRAQLQMQPSHGTCEVVLYFRHGKFSTKYALHSSGLTLNGRCLVLYSNMVDESVLFLQYNLIFICLLSCRCMAMERVKHSSCKDS